MHAHELPSCGSLTATEWVRAVGDRTQARLLVHLINKQEAEENFVRVMAVHGGHLGQPQTSQAAISIEDVVAQRIAAINSGVSGGPKSLRRLRSSKRYVQIDAA